MKNIFLFLLVVLPVSTMGAGKCLKELKAICPSIPERPTCLRERQSEFSAECAGLIKEMTEAHAAQEKPQPVPEQTQTAAGQQQQQQFAQQPQQQMPANQMQTPPPVPEQPQPVAGGSDEENLFNSCLRSQKKGVDAEASCRCLAKNWASGSVAYPNDPSKTFPIKKEYIDHLVADWKYYEGPPIKNGARLNGDEAAIMAISLNIAVKCLKEQNAGK